MLFLRVMCTGMQLVLFFSFAWIAVLPSSPLLLLGLSSISVVFFFYEPLAIIHFCPRHLSRVEVRGGYHEYTEVRSCQDVVHLYHLLWSATILNIVALFLGIITAAVLGGFKDMVRLKCSAAYIGAFCMISEILWHSLGLFLKMPTAAPDSCEPELLPIPPPPETPGPTTSNNSFYNTAPCLPPYTAYDLQVIAFTLSCQPTLCCMLQCAFISHSSKCYRLFLQCLFDEMKMLNV